MRTPHQFSLTGGKARVKPEPCRTAGANPVALNEQIFSAVDGIIGTVVFGEIYGTEQFNLAPEHS